MPFSNLSCLSVCVFFFSTICCITTSASLPTYLLFFPFFLLLSLRPPQVNLFETFFPSSQQLFLPFCETFAELSRPKKKKHNCVKHMIQKKFFCYRHASKEKNESHGFLLVNRMTVMGPQGCQASFLFYFLCHTISKKRNYSCACPFSFFLLVSRSHSQSAFSAEYVQMQSRPLVNTVVGLFFYVFFFSVVARSPRPDFFPLFSLSFSSLPCPVSLW